MDSEIGEIAGLIWRYLDGHGEVTVTNLMRDIKINQHLADRAIGWLSREGKVQIRTQSRKELLSLAR